MRISVVIPVRNEAAIIETCLNAFSRQTISPFEIIIVDNKSTDDTAFLAQKHKNVRVLQEPKIGISNARNAGFDAAKGDIIARCDADTRVEEDWILEIEKFFSQNLEVSAITGPAYFYNLPRPVRWFIGWVFLDSFYWITRLRLGGETLYGSNCALRKIIWDKVRGEVCTDDANMHEDIDLGQHISRFGTIVFNPSVKVGISARPLAHPYRMLKRWRKGLNNFSRHRD